MVIEFILPKVNMRLMAACALALATAQGAVADTGSMGRVFSDAKPIIDLRLREENVKQAGVLNDADALTLRARLGVETGKFAQTSLLVEGEFVEPFVDHYFDTIASHGNTTYATVADPRTREVNRLQLVNASIPNTTLTLGRQRINLDDQRFVGNSGWRQNEQTFDAFRVVNKSVPNLTVDATYLNQVNRVFGADSPKGRYTGDSILANIGYQTPLGKLTAFSYLLKFDPIIAVPAAVSDSSATYGARFAGEHPVGKIKLIYAASYARQKNYGENPLDFSLSYYLGELGLGYKVFNAGVGLEVLEGDGVKGFTTPLATLHKFQGWADRFLTTPANGIKDRYANMGLTMKAVAGLDVLSAIASYHDYQSQQQAVDYGSEIDLQLQAKWKRFTGTLKYADYSADTIATDTKILWAQIEFVW